MLDCDFKYSKEKFSPKNFSDGFSYISILEHPVCFPKEYISNTIFRPGLDIRSTDSRLPDLSKIQRINSYLFYLGKNQFRFVLEHRVCPIFQSSIAQTQFLAQGQTWGLLV